MKSSTIRRMRAVDIGASILLLLAIAAAANAQSGSATAAYVKTVATTQTVASASVPAGGGMGSVQEEAVGLAVLSASSATALATGLADDVSSGVQSVATLGDVVILGGKIKVKHVIAIASSSMAGGEGSASDDGSALSGLEINGVAYDGDSFSPNTRINLPGTGYVIFKERVVEGTSATVNMIHVVLTGLFGNKIGEIIVGSASSDCGS